MWSDCAWDGDRNRYLNATASVEGRSATVRSSPTQGEEKGPAPSNVTIGDGFTDSPSALVTRHLGCNPTTVAVVGRGMTVAMPRDTVGDLSEEAAVCGLSVGGDLSLRRPGCLLLNWEREGTCGRFEESLDLVSETESLLACLKLAWARRTRTGEAMMGGCWWETEQTRGTIYARADMYYN